MAASLSEIKTDSNWGIEAPRINQNFQNIDVELEKLKNTTDIRIRWATSLSELQTMVPNPYKGQFAYVGATLPAPIYKWNGSSWVNTGQTGGGGSIDSSTTYSKAEIDKKLQAQNDSITEIDEKTQELESKINTIESNAVFIDVDKQYPLDSGFYSSDTARNAIPVELRHKNLVITYRVAVTEVVIEQFIGNDIAEWLTSTNWNLISPKVKHVPISASDYEALETKDENTLYYVFEE